MKQIKPSKPFTSVNLGWSIYAEVWNQSPIKLNTPITWIAIENSLTTEHNYEPNTSYNY